MHGIRKNRVVLQLGLTALIVTAGVVAYHDTKFREIALYPDVTPLLEDLSRQGILLGIVTHGWAVKQAEKLVRLGLMRYFEPRTLFISDQIGISKPNPKLYALALRNLGLQPEEAMYVGDNLAHDIAPPQTLGMHTVWARRSARARGTHSAADSNTNRIETPRQASSPARPSSRG